MNRAVWFRGFAFATALLLVGSRHALTSADEATATTAASARDRLYEDLAADVAELERRGSILKRVVKLVTPAVVHIEARRDADTARPARGDSEEAGSGVIIERRGKTFVLTNRHVIKYSTLKGIDVKLVDGRVLHPSQVWTDPATDVAIM